MTSKMENHFPTALTEVHDGFEYPVLLSKYGSAMVLYGGKDSAQPLAAIQLRALGDGGAQSVIFQYPGDTTAFHGLISKDKQEFEVIMTNLMAKHQLNFNLLRNERSLNEVNVVDPMTSYSVRSDYANGHKALILQSLESRGLPLSVREDEQKAKETKENKKGVYISIVICPEKDKAEEFTTRTVWRTANFFVLKKNLPPAVVPALRPPLPIPDFRWGAVASDAVSDWRAGQSLSMSNGPSRFSRVSTFSRASGASFGGRVTEGGAGVGFSATPSWGAPASAAPASFGFRGGASPADAPSIGGPFSFAVPTASSQPAIPASAASFGFHGGVSPAAAPAIATTYAGAFSSSQPAGGFSGAELENFFVADAARSKAASVLIGPAAAPAPSAPVFSEESNVAMVAKLIGDSKASEIAHGERVIVHTQDCGMIPDLERKSPPCTLGLSVMEQVEFAKPMSQADQEERVKAMRAAISAYVNSKYDTFLQEVVPYTSAECCICLETETPLDTIFFKCTHVCAHYACTGTITSCPLCREPISAKLRLPPGPHLKREKQKDAT